MNPKVGLFRVLCQMNLQEFFVDFLLLSSLATCSTSIKLIDSTNEKHGYGEENVKN